jgi:hypothetical protein
MAQLKLESKMRIVMSYDVKFKGSPQELADLDAMVSSICSEVCSELSQAFPKACQISHPQFCLQDRRDQRKDGVVKKCSPPIENIVWKWSKDNAD